MLNLKFISRFSVLALTAFSLLTFAQSNEAEILPYVNSISVSNADMFSGSRGEVTMTVWSGNCTLAIASSAKFREVPNFAKGSMNAIVVTLKPEVTACSNTRSAKLLSVTASLDELVKSAVETIPAEQRQQVRKVIELPMVMPQGLED